MRRASKRDTVTIVCDIANEMGATVLKTRRHTRHPAIRIRTREGAEFWMRVSQGKVDPYVQRGWVRQAINRANKRRANDNGEINQANPRSTSH